MDLYKVLGVNSQASSTEIKAAYRKLVKQHHPDAGGNKESILSINAAWEILRDKDLRKAYDLKNIDSHDLAMEAKERGFRNAQASAAANQAKVKANASGHELTEWLKDVYIPIDRLLGQIINPFPAELKALSADPYDDTLMEAFCTYLEASQKKLAKIENIYRSKTTPEFAKGFSLSLYHCLSQVQDACNEIERYTMGYVDSYLHDGSEMLREAKRRRSLLKQERLRINV